MFAKRINGIDASSIREILKLANNKNIISFAGGLPDDKLFPIRKIKEVFTELSKDDKFLRQALQYSTSEGLPQLRETIAQTYKQKDNLDIDPELIIITTGSQQALDLIGKTFLDESDRVLVEAPSYLAALQSFSFYTKNFLQVELENDGPKIEDLPKEPVKLFYGVVNFQNPTGITWSNEKRRKVAQWASSQNTLLIEDDPYGELRFEGARQLPLKSFYPNTILLGSFSKIFAPGFRIGWLVAPNKEIYQKLLLAKQSADLHSSTFSQTVAYLYYKLFGNQEHIQKISQNYAEKKQIMLDTLKDEFKDISLSCTNPEGGMFLWIEFENWVDTKKLLEYAVKEGVAFVPGEPFFANSPKKNTARLNYTNASPQKIKEGVAKLKAAFERYIKDNC